MNYLALPLSMLVAVLIAYKTIKFPVAADAEAAVAYEVYGVVGVRQSVTSKIFCQEI